MKVLIVQHVPWEHTGIIGDYLRENGISPVTLELFKKSEEIPFESLERNEFSALIALGSPSSACVPETNFHYEKEIELFRLVRKASIPSFDICYSMQMFAIANDGVAEPNPLGKEIGFETMHLTEEGLKDPVFGRIGFKKTLQWHGDQVKRLPSGAIHLAYSDKTKHQVAVVDGIHYLVQGDGQAALPHTIEEWFKRDGSWAAGSDKKKILDESVANANYYYTAYHNVMENFFAIVKSRH